MRCRGALPSEGLSRIRATRPSKQVGAASLGRRAPSPWPPRARSPAATAPGSRRGSPPEGGNGAAGGDYEPSSRPPRVLFPFAPRRTEHLLSGAAVPPTERHIMRARLTAAVFTLLACSAVRAQASYTYFGSS